jgi:DNA-binding phage protein
MNNIAELDIRMRKAGLIPYDPKAGADDYVGLLETVMVSLAQGDPDAAQEVLVYGLRYMNRTRVVKRYGIPRRTLYNLLTFKSVPTLELVAKVCYALKQEAELTRKRDPSALRVDSAVKNGKLSPHGRKALPVGAYPRL